VRTAEAPPGCDALEIRDGYEIIDGETVVLPPSSADSQALATRLMIRLADWAIARESGQAFAGMRYKLPLARDRQRKPKVSFVSYSRWPKYKPLPATGSWDVLPELCAEVMSPNDLADEIEAKVEEYFQAGVRLVWVVYPRHERFYVYESATQIRRLTRADTLDGGTVLPGFTLPLSELFLQAPPTPPAPQP
jgi:Uma2 family endonuclease